MYFQYRFWYSNVFYTVKIFYFIYIIHYIHIIHLFIHISFSSTVYSIFDHCAAAANRGKKGTRTNTNM